MSSFFVLRTHLGKVWALLRSAWDEKSTAYDSVLGPLVLSTGPDRLKLDIVKAQGPPIKTCRYKSIKIMEAVVPPKVFSMGLSRLN